MAVAHAIAALPLARLGQCLPGAYVCAALLPLLALVLLLATASVPASAQLRFDATLARVEDRLILKSDVLWNLALDRDVATSEFWNARIQEFMLRTLVDQQLLLREAEKIPETQPSDESVQQAMRELAAQFNAPGDENRFQNRLALVGLTGPSFESIMRRRVRILNFVDYRFRSLTVVTEPEIVQYFEANVKPTLPDQSEGAVEAAFAARRKEIEQVLTEEKINIAIDRFLEDARSRAEIVMLAE